MNAYIENACMVWNMEIFIILSYDDHVTYQEEGLRDGDALAAMVPILSCNNLSFRTQRDSARTLKGQWHRPITEENLTNVG
jgi:hypothetical protein